MNAAIKNWLSRPPALFPWVALFHLVITVHATWLFVGEPVEAWAHPMSMMLYTVLWFFVCSMYRMAAIGYIALTAINLLLHFMLAKEGALLAFSGAMFPIDVLFSFFLLVYYRQFR